MHAKQSRPQVQVPVWALIALSAVILVIFLITMALERGNLERQKAEMQDTQALVLDAYSHGAELERRVAFAQTDDYVEQQARSEYGYLEPDTVRLMLKEVE